MASLRKSTKLIQDLSRYCKSCDQEFYQPQIDCETRWNSILYMFRSFRKIMKPLEMLCLAEKKTDFLFLFGSDGIDKLEKMIAFLEKIERAVDIVQYEKEPTIVEASLIYIGLWEFFSSQENKTNGYLAVPMKNKLNKV